MWRLLPVALLGWLAGAFVNYLADVLPLKRCLTRPFCPACDAPQPAINYLFWPRRCLECGRRRAWRAWPIEAAFVACAIWLYLSPPPKLGFLAGFTLLIYFGLIVVIDVEHRLILHPISLAGVGLGLLLGVWLHGWGTTLLGGAAGFGIMFLLYFLGDLFARGMSRLRKQPIEEEALGFGDVNLSGVLGLILGWPGIFLGLGLAILIGGLVSLLYLLGMLVARRYRSFVAIPYAPFLIAAALILLYFRDFLASW